MGRKEGQLINVVKVDSALAADREAAFNRHDDHTAPRGACKQGGRRKPGRGSCAPSRSLWLAGDELLHVVEDSFFGFQRRADGGFDGLLA